jgi:hypothetical protein
MPLPRSIDPVTAEVIRRATETAAYDGDATGRPREASRRGAAP